MDREQISGWCEKGILGLVLGILVFSPLALGGNRTWEFLVIQGMTVGVMSLWALRLWVSERPRVLWPPICWAVLAFMIYVLVRYFQAPIEYVARGELIRVLVFGFIFFAILNNLQRQEHVQIIMFTMIFLAMAIACYAGYQFLSKSQKIWNLQNADYIGRGRGTFIYPNLLAGFLEMLAPIGLCYAVMGRLPHVFKIILGYASLVMLAGIGVTLSRGGWAVTGIMLLALCIILLCTRDYRLHGLLMLGCLILALVLVVPRAQMMQRRVEQMMMSGKADDLRFAVWKPAIEIWKENFWWGAGPAHFDYLFAKYRPTEVQLRPEYVHNDYLNTLADYGVVGMGIVLVAVGLLYWGVIQVRKPVRGARDDFSRKKSNKFALLIGASLGLFAILLHSLLDFNMHMASNAILAVTLMAFITSLWRYATERYWCGLNIIMKSAATLVLLAGIIFLAGTGWRKAQEYVWLQRAERAITADNSHTYERIAALEQAFKVEPRNFETSHEIGECYRLKSWEGGDDYVDLAKKAMDWYQRGIKLNPFDPYNWENYGMCLDWIGVQAGEDSLRYYEKANELDPNGYFTTANTGWHYVQLREWAAARTWFERSRRLEWKKEYNETSHNYLEIIENKLKDAAERNKP